MGDLGEAIIFAMRDQGWLVVFEPEAVRAVNPGGNAIMIPLRFFEAEQDMRLHLMLLNLIVTYGLEWPWPPDHREGIHGEVPRFDE